MLLCAFAPWSACPSHFSMLCARPSHSFSPGACANAWQRQICAVRLISCTACVLHMLPGGCAHVGCCPLLCGRKSRRSCRRSWPRLRRSAGTTSPAGGRARGPQAAGRQRGMSSKDNVNPAWVHQSGQIIHFSSWLTLPVGTLLGYASPHAHPLRLQTCSFWGCLRDVFLDDSFA